MMKSARWAYLLVLVFPMLLALVVGGTEAQPTPSAALQGFVTRVVDGDTIYVQIGNQIEKVRYIGINTPEIHHPTKGREPYGEAARQANVRLVEGRWVNLVLDVQARDHYGRLLAYVYVDGRLVNAALVWQGYAEAATVPPNVRYAGYFVDLQRQARETKRGLWADPEAVVHHRPRAPDYAPQSQAGAPGEGRAAGETVRLPSGAISLPGATVPLPPPRSSYGSPPAAPLSSPGGDVNVRGYTRGDGTYVGPYMRSRPGR